MNIDKQQSFKIIQNEIGQSCERSLVCNSLKIRFRCDIDKRGASYIWIDPPWEFYSGNKLITESLNCPEPNAKNYSFKFKKFSNKFQPLNNTKLISAELSIREELTLEFLGGFIIYVPSCPPDEDPEDSYWREHWYAKQL